MVDHQQFVDLDVQILGISTDSSFSQKSFADSLGLPYPLLSDFDATVTQLYAADKHFKAGTDLTRFMAPGRGVRFHKDRIIASQAFFLIDKQGILRGRWLPGDRAPITSEQILKMARDLAGKH